MRKRCYSDHYVFSYPCFNPALNFPQPPSLYEINLQEECAKTKTELVTAQIYPPRFIHTSLHQQKKHSSLNTVSEPQQLFFCVHISTGGPTLFWEFTHHYFPVFFLHKQTQEAGGRGLES